MSYALHLSTSNYHAARMRTHAHTHAHTHTHELLVRDTHKTTRPWQVRTRYSSQAVFRMSTVDLSKPTLSIINMCLGGYHLRTRMPLGTAATTNFWSLYGLREMQQVIHPFESWILCVALLCLQRCKQATDASQHRPIYMKGIFVQSCNSLVVFDPSVYMQMRKLNIGYQRQHSEWIVSKM